MRMFVKLMRVRGNSMLPTLIPNACILVSGIPYFFRNPRVGEIIVLSDPRDRRKIVKRVSQIEEGRYYVLGDNPDESTDSREFGWISDELILGKAVLFYKGKI